MKNKKLFAILTLVCFMFTLMPVAAFAATYEEQVYVSVDGGKTYEEEAEATVKAPFNVRVGDGTTGSFVFYAVDEDSEGVAVSAAVNAATLTINTAGDYKVYAIDVEKYAKDASLLETLGKVEAVATKVDTLVAWAEGLDLIVAGEAYVTVESPDMVYQIALEANASAKDGFVNSKLDSGIFGDDEFAMTIEASDGFNKDGGVIATLYGAPEAKYNAAKKADKLDAFMANKDEWKVIKNCPLTISEAGYVDVAYDTLTTDKKGQVKFNVSADLANVGNKVIVKFGTKAKAELTVDATSAAVSNVEVYNQPVAPANNENTVKQANVEFKFTDANGVPVVLEYKTAPDADKLVDGIVDLNKSEVAITIVEKPAKSTLTDSDFELYKEVKNDTYQVDADEAGVYTLVCTDNGGAVDKDGTYVIKVSMKNGKSATATFKVAEMGEIVRIMFKEAPKTVAYGEKVNAGVVIGMDANGVATKVDAELSANGVAVDAFYAKTTKVDKVTYNAGDLFAKNDDKYIGSTITLMAVYEDFVTTADVAVVDKAATIELVSDEVEVGISTVLEGKIVDASGKVTSIGTLKDVKAIVLDKPENAVAVAAPVSKTSLNDDGNVEISFLASAAGEYKLQIIAVTTADKYVSGIVTVNVGGGMNAFSDVVVVSMGANSMIVNNELVTLDVAPFIENNRTMMQFNVLYVFGIDVQWVKETESIVAEGNGLKVVMNLGSKVAVVNGEEVTLDVAPYSVNGRTVVPVGFITGLLDITPTFTYNADGTIADILFTK